MSTDECCACGPKDRYIVKQQGDLDALRARLAAVTAERDVARAEVAQCQAGVATAREERDREIAVNDALEADRDAAIAEVQMWQSDDALRAEVARLRAAIEPTAANFEADEMVNFRAYPGRGAVEILAAIRARAGEVSAPGSSLRERMELGELRRIRELARLLIATYDQDTAEHDAEEYAEEALRAALGEP